MNLERKTISKSEKLKSKKSIKADIINNLHLKETCFNQVSNKHELKT